MGEKILVAFFLIVGGASAIQAARLVVMILEDLLGV
jgi:hypothetical protein